jgi:hypothetical protein
MATEHTEQTQKDKEKDRVQIQIDRVHYTVNVDTMTAAQLRALVSPPIGLDRDLFEVVPGGTDRQIENADPVRLRNGLRFFTAPTHINPGAFAE